MARNRILIWGLSNNRAGTEEVIANYVSSMPSVSFDFLCYEYPEAYESLIDGNQNRAFVIPVKIQHPLAYKKALRAFMNEHGNEYGALWMNLGDLSNIDLLEEAEHHNIPTRIVHSHSSRIPDNLITQVFTKLNRPKVLDLATHRWACSQDAGRFFFESDDFTVIPNLIDARKCAFSEKERMEVRTACNMESSFVIGNVARIAPEKNQAFLLELLPVLTKQRLNTKLLFVGAGPLEAQLKSQAVRLGVQDSVIWAGTQSAMGSYLSAMDAFAFPSFFEGLPLALLEAQYNGLPCVISDGVSPDVIISKETWQIPLDDQEAWIAALLACNRSDQELIHDRACAHDLANAPGIVGEVLLS